MKEQDFSKIMKEKKKGKRDDIRRISSYDKCKCCISQ